MYATLETMLARFGEAELISLTDNEPPYSRQINLQKLDAAMDMANSEVDAYVSSQVRTPLPNPPKFVVGLACDLARYHAALGASRVTERDEERYNAAIKSLTNIAKGVIKLGLTPEADSASGTNTATMTSGRPSAFAERF